MIDLKIAYYAWSGMLSKFDHGEIKEPLLCELEATLKKLHGDNILWTFTRWADKLNKERN